MEVDIGKRFQVFHKLRVGTESMVLSKMSLFDVLDLNYLLVSRFGISRCMVLTSEMGYMRMRQRSFCREGRCATIVVFSDTHFQARVHMISGKVSAYLVALAVALIENIMEPVSDIYDTRNFISTAASSSLYQKGQ